MLQLNQYVPNIPQHFMILFGHIAFEYSITALRQSQVRLKTILQVYEFLLPYEVIAYTRSFVPQWLPPAIFPMIQRNLLISCCLVDLLVGQLVAVVISAKTFPCFFLWTHNAISRAVSFERLISLIVSFVWPSLPCDVCSTVENSANALPIPN